MNRSSVSSFFVDSLGRWPGPSSIKPLTDQTADLEGKLRNAPTQARSRERLRRLLDAANEVLAQEGAAAFTTKRVAEAARIPIGSVYRYFPDKELIAEALAVSYWSDFEALVAGVADADEQQPFAAPGAAVLNVLAAGFRACPGFLALWYGGLRTEQVRDATRPTRTAIALSMERMLAVHWPRATRTDRAAAARMVVLGWTATATRSCWRRAR
jgi:AcrR family transcriptional regulator